MRWDWLLVAVLYFIFGFMVGRDYGSSHTITTVYKEPTDQQLVEFWFGPADKSQLRKRVCAK